MAFPAPADTYPGKDQVAGYLETYAATFHLPVKCNARVTELTRVANEFEVRTADGVFRSHQVVVATGPFQVPFVPAAAAALDPSVTQIHSAEYRNPDKLHAG
jgi:putative flavoprotein involved in K+ transport